MTTVSLIAFEQPTGSLDVDRPARKVIADTLRANPGRWALLGTWYGRATTGQVAHSIRRGLSGWQMFGPEFEAEAHTMLGEHRIYARYVPEKAAS